MRIKKAIIYASVAVQMATSAQVFGTFQNLDFESANIAGYDPGEALVPVEMVLPGWEGYYGKDYANTIFYDNWSLGGPMIAVDDIHLRNFVPLEGKYSVSLEGASGSVSIGQTGQVPSDSLFVVFYYKGESVGNFEVSFSGQALNCYDIGTIDDSSIYAADISSFAGKSGELRFTESNGGRVLIDGIQFSPGAVPEPGTVALFALGAFAMVGRFAWRRS